MSTSRRVRAGGLILSWWVLGVAGIAAAEPPKVLQHVVVYSEQGRFAGWPANHGIWSWGDEILVGFSRGYYKDRGPFHHIDKEKPEEFLLARSKDAGASWTVEQPRPAGALAGTLGMRHGLMPPGVAGRTARRASEPDRFHAPQLRADGPHGGGEQRSLPVLLLVRPRYDLAGSVPAAIVRAEGGDGSHRLRCERTGRLPAVPDRIEGAMARRADLSAPGRPTAASPGDSSRSSDPSRSGMRSCPRQCASRPPAWSPRSGGPTPRKAGSTPTSRTMTAGAGRSCPPLSRTPVRATHRACCDCPTAGSA